MESELQIWLEKVTSGKLWSSLGVLLPGNAEMTPTCSDIVGKFEWYNYIVYSYSGYILPRIHLDVSLAEVEEGYMSLSLSTAVLIYNII